MRETNSTVTGKKRLHLLDARRSRLCISDRWVPGNSLELERKVTGSVQSLKKKEAFVHDVREYYLRRNTRLRGMEPYENIPDGVHSQTGSQVDGKQKKVHRRTVGVYCRNRVQRQLSRPATHPRDVVGKIPKKMAQM